MASRGPDCGYHWRPLVPLKDSLRATEGAVKVDGGDRKIVAEMRGGQAVRAAA